ncbi:MAG: amidohydrolase family protein [Muribaculaceae bacterium]|nr:amidohydrolase family protein [Muribaculaceae bacterium]MDE6331249.1 amidohydrolase family protein [Muribaculaceae bacterium]
MIVIHNAEVVFPGEETPLLGYVAVDGLLICATGRGEAPAPLLDAASEVVDAGGATLMPGAIDCHVHFREPGLTHKATMASESRAAAAGGVTSWIDMPNTIPPTTTLEAWEEKNRIAAASAVGNYAFFVGADGRNLDILRALPFDRVPGVKLFMGQSTGNMAVQGKGAVEAVFAEIDAPIVVHAEDDTVIAANLQRLKACYGAELPVRLHAELRSAEACVRASERAMELAARYGSRLHLAHISTVDECSMLDAGPVSGKRITAEVSPHHLWWCSADYDAHGARIKMNPAVKGPEHRECLRSALADGRLDIVATDHAPHLLADKAGDLLHAASGSPMVQFSMPAMLTIYNDPVFVARKVAQAPAELFGICGRGVIAEGNYADLVLVERCDWQPHDSDVLSLCGWTPMAGEHLGWRVRRTWINGSAPDVPGQPLTFCRQ